VKRGQSSLEYLLTYTFALLLLGSAMATLTTNRPDVSVPSQCEVSGPFSCAEHTKRGDNLLVLMNPTSQRALLTTNTTLTYQENISSDYCQLNNLNGGDGEQNVNVGVNDQLQINCSVNNLGNVSGPFLSETEEMEVDFKYKEDGLTFWKPAQADILI
jgi:hypothetical protein